MLNFRISSEISFEGERDDCHKKRGWIVSEESRIESELYVVRERELGFILSSSYILKRN